MRPRASPAQGDAGRGRFDSSGPEFDRWPGARGDLVRREVEL